MFEFIQNTIHGQPEKPLRDEQRLDLVEYNKEEVMEAIMERYPNPFAMPEYNDDNSPNIPQFSFKKPPQRER